MDTPSLPGRLEGHPLVVIYFLYLSVVLTSEYYINVILFEALLGRKIKKMDELWIKR
jgi:hypothetical protein